MLFSIVIPAYNAEFFLPACLESVESQTYKDFEVIVVDDGSFDSTPELLDSYAETRLWVKIIHKANERQFLARRDGVAQSSGEYIVFLDSDDALRSDALERIEKAISRSHPDIVGFDFCREPGFKTRTAVHGLRRGFYSNERWHEIRKVAVSGNYNCLCGKAIRRSLLNLDLDPGATNIVGVGEDWLQLLDVIDRSSSLYYLPEALYYYRPNKKSITKTYSRDGILYLNSIAPRILSYAEKWGGSYVSYASLGILSRYPMFAKKIFSASINGKEKRREFMFLHETFVSSLHNNPGCKDAISSLRFDLLLIANAVLAGDYFRAKLVCAMVRIGAAVLARHKLEE